jgi:hypothetical protein
MLAECLKEEKSRRRNDGLDATEILGFKDSNRPSIRTLKSPRVTETNNMCPLYSTMPCQLHNPKHLAADNSDDKAARKCP